jgi:hypothetical protein
MIIIYSDKEILSKAARACIRLSHGESMNIGITGVIISNYSLEPKYVFSSDMKLLNSMKVNTPIQEEDFPNE